MTVTPADGGDREQVAALAEQVQQVTGNTVELAYMDQGYSASAGGAHKVDRAEDGLTDLYATNTLAN